MTTSKPKPVLVIDGARLNDLDGFYDEVSRQLIPGADWGRNLDAFNDILRGGFGTPEGGFVLRWRNVAGSRRVLGHEETAKWYRPGLTRVHPGNIPEWERKMKLAEAGEGETLFDALVEIIRDHGPGGAEAEGGVELVLEE